MDYTLISGRSPGGSIHPAGIAEEAALACRERTLFLIPLSGRRTGPVSVLLPPDQSRLEGLQVFLLLWALPFLTSDKDTMDSAMISGEYLPIFPNFFMDWRALLKDIS